MDNIYKTNKRRTYKDSCDYQIMSTVGKLLTDSIIEEFKNNAELQFSDVLKSFDFVQQYLNSKRVIIKGNLE